MQNVCSHLLAAQEVGSFFRYFTGSGREHHLVCPACASGDPDLHPVSEEEFARIEADGDWEGIRGHPEVPHQASGLRFVEADRSTSTGYHPGTSGRSRRSANTGWWSP